MEDFDLDRYLRASRKVDLSGVRWDQIASHPISPEVARCLAYMMDIESHTIVYLRDVLATKAAFEPDVTAFLSCWVYEELWHGEAFSRFLGEAGYALPPDGERPGWDEAYPTRYARNSWIRRTLSAKGYASHVGTMLGQSLVRDFVAVHMTWGALNELSTLSGYHRLMAQSDHPVLHDVLTRIVKDERRHFAFYRAQARMRLQRSAAARRATRWALNRLWAPVGTGVRPQHETDFVVTWLFDDGDDGHAAVDEIDATISALPGLEGTRFARRSVLEARRRMRRATPSLQAAYPIAATHT